MNAIAQRRRGVHAGAVGHGIAHAIYAAAAPATAEEWVVFCVTAAEEAEAAVRDAPSEMSSAERILRELSPEEDFPELTKLRLDEHRADAHEAGAAAFRACMPKLTGRRTAQAFIACTAAGLQRRYLTGADAKAMLYTVQLALSAHPSRRAQRGRK